MIAYIVSLRMCRYCLHLILGVVLSCTFSTVHSVSIAYSDGATKCGIFVCAYNAVDRLMSEQDIDLYNTVLLAKQRRLQFIPTVV